MTEENLDVLLKASSVFSVPICSKNKYNLKMAWKPQMTTIEKLKYLVWIFYYNSYVPLVFKSPAKSNTKWCN